MFAHCNYKYFWALYYNYQSTRSLFCCFLLLTYLYYKLHNDLCYDKPRQTVCILLRGFFPPMHKAFEKPLVFELIRSFRSSHLQNLSWRQILSCSNAASYRKHFTNYYPKLWHYSPGITVYKCVPVWFFVCRQRETNYFPFLLPYLVLSAHTF